MHRFLPIPHFGPAAILMIAAFMISCAPSVPPQPAKAERVLYQWHDDGGPGTVNLHISLSKQIATIKRGEREIGWCYVATGREGYSTRPGNYPITEKIVDKYSNRYGWFENEYGEVVQGSARYNERVPAGLTYVPAPMPYWMRLTSYGIGLHGGLIPEPGKPASHGCIRLPKEFVPLVYNVVKIGTPVRIVH